MKKEFWKEKRIFITGATGLLGSWLIQYLKKTQAHITILVRDWIPQSKLLSDNNINNVNIVKGELEDFELIKRIINEYEIDTIFHLGAQTIVTIANRNPMSTFESNIKGTWNILEAARVIGGVERIVIASSDKAYGSQEKLPYTEEMPLKGEHPYDVSKSCGDLLAQMYFQSYKLPVCVTRCGNFYGGGDLNFNRIIPGTILSILQNEEPIIRSDGKYIRDYFYIEDAVEAYLFLAEKMNTLHLEGEAFNFSNELQMTVLDIVNKIIDLMKSKLKPKILDEVKNEIPHQYLSAKKAKEKLKWKSVFTLEEGLIRTIDWYKKNMKIQ